jgi:phosphomannomutase
MTKKISTHIFRAYDIRGLYGKDIDPILFYQIGLSAGTYLKKNLHGKTMAVGNDIRQSSHTLVHAFIAGVTATGVNVSYTQTTSFGQTLFAGWKSKKDLIAFVTASHLPPEWNGIKFYYGDGVGLPEDELNKIRDNTLEGNWDMADFSTVGRTTIVDAKAKYENFFNKSFTFSKKIKVAVDCGGASMTLSAPSIFKRLGLHLVPVYCEPDPLFSQRPSDPKPENLETLKKTVKKENCDFGVAFDGDGDRSVIVDNNGNVLSADETGIIIGKYGLQDKKGTIIANVECSKTVSEQLKPLGFSIKKIQVGHTFLTLHAKKENALLGIESSGHLILPEYFLFDDALVVPLKIAEILEENDKSLSDLRDEIPSYPTKKVEIPSKDDIKFTVMKQLKKSFTETYENTNTLDGVRIDFPEGWVLIRASNTSPLIRLTTEAKSQKLVDDFVKTFTEKTQEVINSTS